MPPPPELSPRKVPRQERSRRTMERIVDAAARVLAEHGYDGASTNRIAAAAGISSGSLYQYFPNKDAIVLAVLDRFADRLTARMSPRLETALAVPWRDGVHAFFTILIDELDANAGMLRTVVERVPDLEDLDRMAALHARMSDLTRMYLLIHRDRFRDDLDLDAAVWIMGEVAGQLGARYVLRRPPLGRDRIVAELTTLVTRYLER